MAHECNVVDEQYLFEYQSVEYTYSIGGDALLKPPYRLLINDRLEKSSNYRPTEQVHLLAGRFDISDAVGTTRIRIVDADDRLVFVMETEVYPQKMDFASDYQAMMAEIAAIVHNLSYEALKDTFKHSRSRVSGHTTEHEWWAILDDLFEQLLKNLTVIIRQPKHEIHSADVVLPIDKVKRASRRNVDWIRRNSRTSKTGETGIRLEGGRIVTHALASRKHVTYDTYENRFVAWAIRALLDRLRTYRRTLQSMKGIEAQADLLKRVVAYQGRLQAILHASPFAEASPFEERAQFSTTMTRGSGYRDFLVIHLLLTRGLEMWDNEIFRIGQKNVSTLYEYWSFLKIVQILREQIGSPADLRDLIKVSAGRTQVALKKGKESKVHFTNATTGDSASIYYNRTFTKAAGKVYTYDQAPDISLQFTKKGFGQPFWQLFDAKYRFDERAKEGGNTYDAPQDAIGQLHRYRDAILHTRPQLGTYRSALKNLGGAILYPYPLDEESFKSSTYFRSLEEVNIGALPFLPNKTLLLSKYVSSLLAKHPSEHFEDFIEMDRSHYDSERARWNDWVTIGVIPKSAQALRQQFFEATRLFHVPFVRDTHSKLFMSKELLVCLAGTTTAYLCSTDGWEVLSAAELTQAGASWVLSRERYVVFRIAEHRVVQTPHFVAPSRFRYSTREGLRRYLASAGADQAQFYLTSADAARLYEELSANGIAVHCGWGRDGQDPTLVQFHLDETVIQSSERYGPLHYMLQGERLHLSEVLRRVIK